jgi:hypothetical protein
LISKGFLRAEERREMTPVARVTTAGDRAGGPCIEIQSGRADLVVSAVRSDGSSVLMAAIRASGLTFQRCSR